LLKELREVIIVAEVIKGSNNSCEGIMGRNNSW
jgi:hypothetical protein